MAVNTCDSARKDVVFATGKVSSVLIKFAIPAIISLFVAELYNMVDTVFAGIAIGSTGVGALTISFPIQRLISSLGLLIAIGASTMVARSLGEGNEKKVSTIITNSLFIMILVISILIISIYVFKNSIINGLGSTHNIFPLADKYISIVILGGLFQCFTIVIGYILTALGNARINLIATSMGAICNVIIDYILVIVFSLGIRGAAIATVSSQIISSIYIFYHFLKVKNEFNLSLKFSLNKKITLTIIAVGFSTFIVEISDAVVAVVLNNLLVPFGDSGIVIIGVISKVSMFMYITIIGISSAMQPIVAFNYGAKNFKRVKDVIKKCITAVWISSIILWILMLIFSPIIIGTFIKDKDILVQAVKAFRIVICIFPCIGTYFVAIYYYQAIEEAKMSLILSIYRQILIFIPLVFVLVRFLGIVGIWIAYPVSDLISAFTGFYYMHRAMKSYDNKYKEYILKKHVKRSYSNKLGSVKES
ncbi:MATE family efflux transporter [Haloimpatiens sp. FM7330]|uniref:MATE family efflux transporter n=1 Tax=Haloimpatiens sp. FM7330 TaxID=3298610 RepID=UPI003640B2EB